MPQAEITSPESAVQSLAPLQVLYEAEALPALDLPEQLQSLYGGSALGFAERRLYASFVSTLDGAVAIPSVPRSNRLISAGSAADRFVLGLLRACADVVLIGSGTLHGSPDSRWTPDRAYPPARAAFRELRRSRGQPAAPTLAVVTGSGELRASHPALAAGALVLTTERAGQGLRRRLPAAATVLALGEGTRPDPGLAVEALRQRGHRLILSEAGPHLFGALLRAGLVDELFLTHSPLVAGRSPQNSRLHLVEGAELLPGLRRHGRLLSVRRHEAHLFLRYAFGSGSNETPSADA